MRLRLLGCLMLVMPGGVLAQDAPSDSVDVRLQGVELGKAVQLLGSYLSRPVLFVGQSNASVTLETPAPIARHQVLRLLRGLVESHGFELVDDSASGLYRVRPRPPVQQAQTLSTTSVPRAGIPELFVIPLRHARASDVAQTVNALYGRSGSGTEVAPLVSTLGAELRGNLVAPIGELTPPAVVQQPQRAAALSGELIVVPDARGNSLLVRANRTDYELVLAVVERIDVRPLQVIIEVLIAEVRRDRSLGIAVEGQMSDVAVGNRGATASAGLEGQGLGDFALKVMGIGGISADATLNLAAQRGEVRILSRPVLLATNNQQSSIVIGSQRPFVQVQRALPTDNASRDQIVQYKEVGTKLTVQPSISIDGAVHLDVLQEVSSATAETAFNAPVISTRSIQTQLLVRDGQTVVLGGLADRQRDVAQRGLPLLSAIPLLGGLFGSAERRTTETELFVFLTPRVIRTDDDAMRLSAPYEERAKSRQP